MARLPHRFVLPIALLAALPALAACGDDSEPTARDEPTSASPTGGPDTSEPAAPTSTPPDLPACADLWVEGEVLASPYAGCLEPDGAVSKSLIGCVNRKVAQHGDDLYAIVGGRIVRAEPNRNHNDVYLDLLASCTG